MSKKLSICALLTLASIGAYAETGKTKSKREPTQAAFCDKVARNILATNAKNKIEDSSKEADFTLNSTTNFGDASTSRVVSIYTDPSDKSSYMFEFYGEGCALKALIHL